MLPLPYRAPASTLRRAREDHAACLSLAALCRVRLARGEADARERHALSLDHARRLRDRFPGLTEITA